jgi:hypothetical protein
MIGAISTMVQTVPVSHGKLDPLPIRSDVRHNNQTILKGKVKRKKMRILIRFGEYFTQNISFDDNNYVICIKVRKFFCDRSLFS